MQNAVGGRFKQSGLGTIWRDEHTWRGLAQELVKSLAGSIVFVDRALYEDLVRDARQMRRVRQRVADYYALTPTHQQDNSKSAMARWAEENMKGPPK